MKRRLLSIPTRAMPLRTVQAWTCRRCLAQSAIAPVVGDDFIAPPAAPQQTHDMPVSKVFATTSVPTNTSSQWPGFDEINRIREEFERQFLDASTISESRHARRLEWAELLKRDLPHDVPNQHLTHINTSALTHKERQQRLHMYQWAMTGHVNNEGVPKDDNSKEIKGVVVSVGKMQRTVKVRTPGQRWEPRIKKYYASHTDHLVHDPNGSLLEGDVVILHRLHVAKTVRHVIGSVAVPYGTPLEDRPPIWTPEERLGIYKQLRFKTLARQKLKEKAKRGNTEAIAGLLAMRANEPSIKADRKAKLTPKKKTTGQKAAENIAKQRSKTASNVQEARSKKSRSQSTRTGYQDSS